MKKYTVYQNSTITMSELSGENCSQNKQKFSNGVIPLPILKVLPQLAIHICHQCARLLGAHRVQHTVWLRAKNGDLWGYLRSFLQRQKHSPRPCGAGHTWWGSGSEKRRGRHKHWTRNISSSTEQWGEAAPLPTGKCIYVERKKKST